MMGASVAAAPPIADVGDVLADFVLSLRFEDLPDETVRLVKLSVLDVIASALAGTAADGVEGLAEVLRSSGGAEQSVVIGDSARLPFLDAVVLNTTMGRALEMDDVHEVAMVHPTVANVPTGLAYADWRGPIDGARFLTACVAGMEVTCRLGLAPEYHVAGAFHRPRWMSFTYQCATFGAAAVVGKLAGLSRDGLLDAFGNAYSQMAGNQQGIQEGALIVRVQQGLTARAGALAALLAERGITGPRRAFEGLFGYFNAYYQGRYDRERIIRDLGRVFEIDGISIKPYPCCKIAHPTIAAGLSLLAEHDLSAEQIRRVVVHVNSRETWDQMCQPLEVKRRPPTSVDAQFSIPFTLAAALVRRRVTLDELSQAAVRDPKILAMAEKVEPVIDPQQDVSQGRFLPTPVTVELHLTDGSVRSRELRFPPGHPENRMGWSDLVEKLHDGAERAKHPLPRERQDQIVATVDRLERLADVRELTGLLAR